VAIIGGGPAGLAAASTIKRKAPNSNVALIEAEEKLGGRVRSDKVDGFTLDRGFAVFIDSYPQSKKLLDYRRLKLRHFQPGAFVVTSDGWKDGMKCGGDSDEFKISRVADPFRRPQDIVAAVTSPVGSLFDKLKVIPLLLHVVKSSEEELFNEPETDTLTALKDRWGFSEQFICQFFEPFLGGIYLAPLKNQSSRMFHFIFKMFTEGSACLPEGGMSAVPESIEKDLRNWRQGMVFTTGTKVTQVTPMEGEDEGRWLVETQGDNVKADQVVVATEGPRANELLKGARGTEGTPQRSVGCVYYSLTNPPVTDPILILNGCQEKGTVDRPVNNCCFPSVVSETFAPPGKHLASATVLGPTMDLFRNGDGKVDEEKLDLAVRAHLQKWFPAAGVNRWETLKVYDVKNAQPAQFGCDTPANVNGAGRNFDGAEGVVVVGDHVNTATLNGAFESGVRGAREVVRKM